MLELDIYIVLAQLINFGILYGIFKMFIADKLYGRIQERRYQLEKLHKAEEHYEEKMQIAFDNKEKMMKETRKTTKDLMNESEKIAKQKAEQIIAKANADTLSILEGGRRELEKERLSMLAQMKKHIVDVSLKLNEKMFGEQKMSKEFIEKELKEI